MNTKERLHKLIDALGLTKAEFERRCGLSNGYINSVRNNVGEKGLNLILEQYPNVNKHWLVFGDGEMFVEQDTAEPEQPKVIQHPSSVKGNIRYWEDVAATGGSLEFLENPDEHKIKYMNVPNFSDCTDAVNIYGDSMYPIYKNGEIIILKAWNESFIDYGNVYLIVTRSGNRMIKYLRKSADDSKVLCVSENKAFDSFEIEKSDILRLFLVKGSLRKDTM